MGAGGEGVRIRKRAYKNDGLSLRGEGRSEVQLPDRSRIISTPFLARAGPQRSVAFSRSRGIDCVVPGGTLTGRAMPGPLRLTVQTSYRACAEVARALGRLS